MTIYHEGEALVLGNNIYTVQGYSKWYKEMGGGYMLDDFSIQVYNEDDKELDPDMASEVIDKFLDEVDVEWHVENADWSSDEQYDMER